MNELTRLADGSTFVVRPMEPADAEAVLAGFDALSPASLRPASSPPCAPITPAVLADLVTRRPRATASCCSPSTTATGRLAGGVRAVRDRDDPTAAEVSP